MRQEEINDLLERPQPTCASMFDMPKEESPHLAAIADARLCRPMRTCERRAGMR